MKSLIKLLVIYLLFESITTTATSYLSCSSNFKSFTLDKNYFVAYGFSSLPDNLISFVPGHKYGMLWYQNKFTYFPKFTINLNIIKTDRIQDIIDGFTIIIGKEIKDGTINSNGGYFAYHNLSNLVVGEFDLYQNTDFYDISKTSISIHECTNSVCSAYENPAWSTQKVISYDVSLIN